MSESTSWREERFVAWCAVNDEGIPIATSVRNNKDHVLGQAVECRIVVRKPIGQHEDELVWVVKLEAPL